MIACSHDGICVSPCGDHLRVARIKRRGCLLLILLPHLDLARLHTDAVRQWRIILCPLPIVPCRSTSW
jgi:hypothetical protein